MARREAENGLRQTYLAFDIIRGFIKDHERPFKLTQNLLLQLHAKALEGLHPLAGTYRNGPASITGSKHTPPHYLQVADEVADLCAYINGNWSHKSAIHLCAYSLWRLNWIHPFADGNGRTARAASYVILSVKLDSLLPGTRTIPDRIADNKRPYYEALETSDEILKNSGKVDVSQMEELLDTLLAAQLVQAAEQAGMPG